MSVYLIVGSSSTIGSLLTEKLLEKGHKVYGTYNTTLLDMSTKNLVSLQWDVNNEFLTHEIAEDFIDGVVYCPGAINLKSFERIGISEFKQDLDLQLFGAVKVLQSVLPKLKKSSHPSIVLFSSVAVRKGFPFHASIGISKGALEGLTLSLAAELAPRIRVNCIAPSLVETKLSSRLTNNSEKKEKLAGGHPLKRIGQPTDIVNAAMFLLSSDSSWITGQIISVDGGKSTLA